MAEISIDIKQAAKLLAAGDLVAIPTETVYGLAGNALDEKAVVSIYEVKERPRFNPLILHVASLEQAEEFVLEIPDLVRKLAKKCWPGALTFLLPKNNNVPDLVTAGSSKVAIRMPRHPLTLELLQTLDFPLVAPSANKFNAISPTKPGHVQQQIGEQIKMILDGGPCMVGVESTIIEITEGKLIAHRLGGLPIEEIEAACGLKAILPDKITVNSPLTPGQLKKHYAPDKPLIVGDIEENLEKYRDKNPGILSYSKIYTNKINVVLSKDEQLAEAASHLFEALYTLNQADCDIILAEYVPDMGIGRAINDRLRRASAQ